MKEILLFDEWVKEAKILIVQWLTWSSLISNLWEYIFPLDSGNKWLLGRLSKTPDFGSWFGERLITFSYAWRVFL